MDSLPNLPRMNKSHFISSFIASQKANAKVYAEEGKAVALTWQPSPNTSSPRVESNRKLDAKVQLVFGTPVLKPRKQPTAGASLDTTTQKLEARPPDPSPKKLLRSASSKKRRQGIYDDGEKLARLEERRTRKRAKRDITRPQSPVEVEQLEPDTSKKMRKGKQDERAKRAPAGAPALALLHGFSAPNVCKNRLTLDPAKFGVFNKGKASTKVQIQRKKKKSTGKALDASLAFSETNFLSKASKSNAKMNMKSTRSVHEPDLESTESGQTDISKDQPDRSNRSSDHADADAGHGARSESKPIESEVWDIEMDGVELPSAVSNCNSDKKMDTRRSTWIKQLENGETETPRGGTHASSAHIPSAPGSDDISRRPSSSIAPSQSASQCRPLRRARSLITSRYFQSNPAHPAPNDASLQQPTPVLKVDLARSPSKNDSVPVTLCDRQTSASPSIQSIPFAHPPQPPPCPETLLEPKIAPSPHQHEQEQYQEEKYYQGDRPQRAATPYYSDVDLSYLGCPVQEEPHRLETHIDYDGISVDGGLYLAVNYGNHIEFLESEPDYDLPALTYAPDGSQETDDYFEPRNEAPGTWLDEDFEPEEYSWDQCLEHQTSLDCGDLEEEAWYDVDESDGIGDNYEGRSDVFDASSGYQPELYRGRELLLGLSSSFNSRELDVPAGVGLAAAEADVVVNMRGHWWPQKL
ncbi:hypothetical protein V5O48_008035 [Marasmius crinis-equi]|uniref:Transcription factor Iwr1 domain-containing protein n=1 Tax=Marasmius crinis-equi TaxID=585013 RepID=A0ABR3FFE2_9AGAR